jgi:hypothetical protein
MYLESDTSRRRRRRRRHRRRHPPHHHHASTGWSKAKPSYHAPSTVIVRYDLL